MNRCGSEPALIARVRLRSCSDNADVLSKPIQLALAISSPFLVVTAVAAGCAPWAAPCVRDDECVPGSACVEGGCVDAAIGRTPERARPGIGFDVDTDDDVDADRAVASIALPAYGLLQQGAQVFEGTPVVPAAPLPPSPVLNDGTTLGDLRESCLDIRLRDDTAVSGRYVIADVRTGAPVEVECDMDTDGGGWTIVVDLAREGCPQGWRHTLAGCATPLASNDASALFPLVVPFFQTRGAARAWSTGANQGFSVAASGQPPEDNELSIDEVYVDGLGLSINSGYRTHLFTFAAGNFDEDARSACPTSGGIPPPVDVEYHFACDRRTLSTLELWNGDGGGDDVAEFSRNAPVSGQELEARIMRPPGAFSPVYVTALAVAVR